MAITGREAYEIRNWAKTNQGLHPMLRKWHQLIDEAISEGGGGVFPTTTTTTTSSTTTTTTA
jgi:cobyrinic acid a,c-diamide synthase